VQPVFVQASSGTQLPQLQKVLVAFGTEIAFEDTLNEALNALFGGDSGANAGDEEVVPTDPETAAPDDGSGATPETPTVPVDDYETALQDARQAMLDRDAAMKAGDWTAYGEADQRLTDAVDRLLALDPQ
jgi:uncharacterized membrane protein (UPF0182 family)